MKEFILNGKSYATFPEAVNDAGPEDTIYFNGCGFDDILLRDPQIEPKGKLLIKTTDGDIVLG